MTTEYTQNFRLNLPDFRMGPWHDLVNDNTTTIDELLMSVLQGVNTVVWTNNTSFDAGVTCIDLVDNSYWICSVTHTSAPLPTTFAQDRTAHPTYWGRVVVGVAPRGEWLNSTHYLPNDMVTASSFGIVALCKTEHTSNASGTIKDDAIYWTYLMNFAGDTPLTAINVGYNNTASGVPSVNVQTALDLNFANDAALTSRVTAAEGVNTTQNTNITNNTNAIAAINTAGYITDAPNDGVTYGRKNHAWASGLAAALTISDTPPSSPSAGQIWFESDTGNTYIYYQDANSAQWVMQTGGIADAVRYGVAQTLTVAQKQQSRANIATSIRGRIAGLTLSTPGSSNTFSVSVGEAADSTAADMMQLGAAISKTTAAWTVGSGNGGLDTGTISAGTAWYHVHLIKRLDTGVVDVLISLSATAPTLPANYTLFRRIGSMRTQAGGLWSAFSQQGDEFLWAVTNGDVYLNTTLGTSAVLVALSVPLAVKPIARLRGFIYSTTANMGVLVSSPDETDQAPGVPTGNYTQYMMAAATYIGWNADIRVDASSQVRCRANLASSTIAITTFGWIDTRGRFA